MTYFLDAEDSRRLRELARMRNMSHISNSGAKTTRRAFLNGINVARISNVSLRVSSVGTLYWAVDFERDPEYINDRREVFGIFKALMFYPSDMELLQQLCLAVGHTLLPRPASTSTKSYVQAVYRRLYTFIGRELKVAVLAYTDTAGDGYGETETRIGRHGIIEDVEVTRMQIIGCFPRDTNPQLNWTTWLNSVPSMLPVVSEPRREPKMERLSLNSETGDDSLI